MRNTASKVASYIVAKCANDFSPITNLQLQKILYYIQKKYMASGGYAFDDDFFAWKYGPVIPEVYHAYSYYGGLPLYNAEEKDVELSKSDRDIIDPIVETKRKLWPWQMVEETHRAGGAWAKTYNNGTGIYTLIVIPVA